MARTSPHFFYPGDPVDDGTLRITMLGTGTPFPRRGQACTCLLVEAGSDDKFLIDCGSGAPQNFASLEIPFTAVEKVFLTNHHVVHIGGLDHFWIGGWVYGRRTPLKVWGPPGTNKIVDYYRGIYEWDVETRLPIVPPGGHVIESQEYGEGVIYDQNGVKITAFPVIHTPPHNTYGMRIDYKGRVFVFSADTKKCQAVIDQAVGCDLLIHEAFPPAEIYAKKANRDLRIAKMISEEVHTSPREAGEVFAATRPRLAVLYHLYNNDDLIVPVIDDVRKTYDGPVEIAYDLMVMDVGDEVRVRKAVVDDKPWPVGPTT